MTPHRRRGRPRRAYVMPGASAQFVRHWREVDEARTAHRAAFIACAVLVAAVFLALWIFRPTPAGAAPLPPAVPCATPAPAYNPIPTWPAQLPPPVVIRPNTGGIPPRPGATAIPAKPVVGGAP